MKRRGFLAGLLGVAPVGAMAAAISRPVGDTGIYVPLNCGNMDCGHEWRLFVDLTKPIAYGSPQCPRCLHVMQWPEDSAQRIKEWNLAHGHKTTIYTPRAKRINV